MTQTDSPVAQFMTNTPHGIDPHETLAVARHRMQELKIRHLPVRSGGKVIGAVTERDLFIIAAFPEVDFRKAQVSLAMTPDPYCVKPSDTVRDVAGNMAERRIGCALVVDDQQQLLGIFTDTDALKILAYA